jgi:hypothetical protein
MTKEQRKGALVTGAGGCCRWPASMACASAAWSRLPPASDGGIIARPVPGGLHHEYEWMAA